MTLTTDEVLTAGSTAIAETPMNAQRRLGLALSWPRITSAFLMDVAVLILAAHAPHMPQNVGLWVGVAGAVVATVVMVVTHRGITFASALANWLWAWSAPEMFESSPDPKVILSPGCTPAIDHRRRFSREVVGVREYQGQVVAAIAVDERADAPSSEHQRQTVSSGTLPVAAVAAGLRQFDVRVDTIDIVSVQKRIPEAAGQSGPPTVANRPAGIERGTWLVLRMNPLHNVAAVAVRDSVASTLAAAVERLAGELNAQRLVARPLTGDELAEVDTAVTAGLEPTSIRPGWRHLKHPDGYATSFWVSPRDITSETLDSLWLHDTDAAVVTIRLTTARGGPEVSAWVRYHSSEPLGKDAWPGLNRLTGRQLAAVRASLPAPATRSPLVVPSRALCDNEQLMVGVGPTLIGAAPKDSMSPAKANEDARRAVTVNARDTDAPVVDQAPETPHSPKKIDAMTTAQPPPPQVPVGDRQVSAAAIVDARDTDAPVVDQAPETPHSPKRIEAVTTAQPPPLQVPVGARPVGASAAIIEDDNGGRVYVHGNLAYAWDADDAAGRRFAAVSLTRIKVATRPQVAAAFAVNAARLRRWESWCSDAGGAGLLTKPEGPKRKSKLTPNTVAATRLWRAGGASYRTVAATVGASLGSLHNALRRIHTGAEADSEGPCAPTGSDNPVPQGQEPKVELQPAPEVDAGAEDDCPATASAVKAAPPNEQLVARVCPTPVGPTPTDSMSPATGTDDAGRAQAVDADNKDGPAVDQAPETPHSPKRIEAVTTAQPPPLQVPVGARPVGASAAIIEDDDGGRVYVHGNLAYAWDADDAAGRRFAAVSLTRIKVATRPQVAAAFTVNPARLRRWESWCSDAGGAGLLTKPEGPKRKSKLTPF